MILDGVVRDVEVAGIYDRLLAHQRVYLCEQCGHRISAEESQAFGIGYDCAADIGRRVWAERREQLRLEMVAGRIEDVQAEDAQAEE